MGTRGLTAVVKDGDFKVAQYGQWDHYPSGQGQTILDFLNGLSEFDYQQFTANLDKVRWAKDGEVQERWAKHGADDSGWVTMAVSRAFSEEFPWLSRDAGAAVLHYIRAGLVDILTDQREFAADSLFCEWAYVLDLDFRTLTVYQGFQTEEHDEAGHFSSIPREEGDYTLVRKIATFSFDNLPVNFVQDYNEETDEEVLLALDKDGNNLLG